MDIGSITLLEICQFAHGSHIAYCLTRGEFLFVTADAPRHFRSPSAGDLFGKNLRDFVVQCDLEKLQDYMRAHLCNGVLSNEVASKLTMAIRLVGSGQTLWVRMKTVPLSLRLLRCIDSVTVLASLKNHFADLSSFVVGQDDLASIFTLASRPSLLSSQIVSGDLSDDDDVALSIAIPSDYKVPLELKSVTPSHCDDNLMSTSPASPTGLLDSLDESLSSLAFEADWATEAAAFN